MPVSIEQITAPQDDAVLVRFEVNGLRLGAQQASTQVQLPEQDRKEYLEALAAGPGDDGAGGSGCCA